MKWRRARSPNGTSASCTPGGYQRLRIGKFGRCRCGAAPIAVSRLVARARWSISCLVTSMITVSQSATLASCSALSPSCWVRLRVNCPNRYSHISPCSSSHAWTSNQTSSSRLSTRSGDSTAMGPPGFRVLTAMLPPDMRSHALPTPGNPPHDVQQVFLAVERIVVRPRPGRDRAADRSVVVEGAFQHALAASQRRQLLLQLVHPSRRNLTLQRARRAPHRRCVRDGVQPSQYRQYRSERVCRDLEVEAVDRLVH